MSSEDIKALRIYIVLAALFLCFYAYSGIVGWRWFFNTPTEHSNSDHTNHTHGRYYYHK